MGHQDVDPLEERSREFLIVRPLAGASGVSPQWLRVATAGTPETGLEPFFAAALRPTAGAPTSARHQPGAGAHVQLAVNGDTFATGSRLRLPLAIPQWFVRLRSVAGGTRTEEDRFFELFVHSHLAFGTFHAFAVLVDRPPPIDGIARPWRIVAGDVKPLHLVRD